jgi:hypothetical protein
MHAPGYAITAEKDAVLGQDLTGLAGLVPRLSRHRQQPAVVLFESPIGVDVPPPGLRVGA